MVAHNDCMINNRVVILNQINLPQVPEKTRINLVQVTMALQRECREQESVKDGDKDGRSTTNVHIYADLNYLESIQGSLGDTKPKRCAILPVLHAFKS